MLRRIIIFISLIAFGIVLSSSLTFAASHTFSVYGHVQDYDGTPMPGTTIRLIEPISNTSPMFGYDEPAIQSTIADSKGDFQLINVTTNYSICGLDIEFPANAHPANPQYANTASQIETVNTSGIQYVNITRLVGPNPDQQLYSSPSDILSSLPGILVIIGLGVVCLFVLFCLYKALHHKK